MESFSRKLWRAYSIRTNLRHLFIRSKDNYKVVDGLRAFSTLMVVIFHCYWHLQYVVPHEAFRSLLTSFPFLLKWVWHGDRGMDIFFVISGFLIGVILFKEWRRSNCLDIGRFYYRRAMRILPAYYLGLIATYFLTQGLYVENIWANLLFLNQLLPFEKTFMPWTWSLAVEMQFYLIFPLFLTWIFFRVKRRLLLLILIFLSSFLVRIWVIQKNPELVATPMTAHIFSVISGGTGFFDKLHVNIWTRFGPLVCGVMAAYLVVFWNEEVRSFFAARRSWVNGIWLFSIALILFTMSISYFNPEIVYPRWQVFLMLVFPANLFGLAVGFVMLASLYPSGLSVLSAKFLGLKFWYPIAQLTYSIFLFHILVLLVLFFAVFQKYPQFLRLDPSYILLGSFLVFLCSCLIGVLVYLGIERPLMNLRGPAVSAGES